MSDDKRMKQEIELKAGYLWAAWGGFFELEQAKAHYRDMLAACEEFGVDSAYVEILALENSISTTDRYYLGVFVADQRMETGQPKRLAAVVSETAYTGFAELVARNRGVSFLKVSTSREEALAWLGVGEGRQ